MTLEALIAVVVALATQPVEHARIHVEAAVVAAEQYNLPVELLLAVAYVESRFDERALSRIECATPKHCKRKTGVWAPTTKPLKARPSWYCGPLQSGGYVPWDECQRMRTDLAYGYAVGARELATWQHDPRCRRLDAAPRLRCALAGYSAGYAGVAAYRTNTYVDYVLGISARITRRAREKPSS